MAGRVHGWHWLARVALVVAFLPSAMAGASAPSAPAEAQAWLGRLNAAAAGDNYRGIMVFAAGGVVSSSRVAHMCVGDQVYERVEALDGHMHRIYRHNETVHTVWPNRQTVVVDQPVAVPGLMSTRRRVEPRALEHYALRVLGKGRVAGRMARQLLLEPGDDLRFAQRLWADEDSGLLLRADVLSPQGRVLESSAFTEVDIGGATDAGKLLEGMTPAGYKVVPSGREPVDWHALGWRLRSDVPGFKLMGCVRRPAPSRGADAHALQAVFSDGLSFVSIFIEPYVESRHLQPISAEIGAMHTVMRRLGDHWITAMGDVPHRTLEQFIDALERRP